MNLEIPRLRMFAGQMEVEKALLKRLLVKNY